MGKTDLEKLEKDKLACKARAAKRLSETRSRSVQERYYNYKSRAKQVHQANKQIVGKLIDDCKRYNSLKYENITENNSGNNIKELDTRKKWLNIIKEQIHIVRSLNELEKMLLDTEATQTKTKIANGDLTSEGGNVTVMEEAKLALKQLGMDT